MISNAHPAVVRKAPVKYRREMMGISMYHDMKSKPASPAPPIAAAPPAPPKSMIVVW